MTHFDGEIEKWARQRQEFKKLTTKQDDRAVAWLAFQTFFLGANLMSWILNPSYWWSALATVVIGISTLVTWRKRDWR